MKVNRLISSYHNSNTYIIETEGDNKVVLIDPGDPDISALRSELKNLGKEIRAILLTHEHADHCAGVQFLEKEYTFDLFCTAGCKINMADKKQNFSFYIDIINEFEIDTPAEAILDDEEFSIGELYIRFIHTPGHSPGSAVIQTENLIFTGDTFLNNLPTPLTFPHSNRQEYFASVEKLRAVLKPGMMIFPGHGESFTFTRMEDYPYLWGRKKNTL